MRTEDVQSTTLETAKGDEALGRAPKAFLDDLESSQSGSQRPNL